MNRFRSRLIFAIITLIIAVLIGLGLLLGQIFGSYYMNSFQERIKEEAKITELFIQEKGFASPDFDSFLQNYSDTINSHITIYDRNGNVLKDAGPFQQDHDAIAKEILLKHRNSKKGFKLNIEEDNLYFYGLPYIEKDVKQGYIVLSSTENSLKKINQQIWILLIASLGLALLVILLLAVRITSRYTRPIESATNVAMELAKGNYKARTYEDHMDETGMLSQSINILARNLQDMNRAQEMQQDRLQTLIENMGSGLILIDGRGYINLVNRAYKELFNIESTDFLYKLYYEAFQHKEIVDLVEHIFMTEIKARKQLHLPLKIERRHFEVYGAPIIGTNDEWKGIVLVFHDITELKKLEQMRKDFVANVSHELKTPITSIKGFTETLLDGALEDKQTLEYFLSIILKESDRLQTLIQDLLDLSKIEQQGFKLNLQNCNAKEILEEVIIILKSKADEKEIELSLHVNSGELYVYGDVYRLKQIFINLISNALNYTPKGGRVQVFLKDGESYATFIVSDTGIGIEKEEIPRIFERFYRVDKARSRNSGGTGLGLAIVKHLVEAHKGQIFVNSTVGEGTTFTVKLNKNHHLD
ncbi:MULTISPECIES: two-component system histidine kinase PnpS [Metabacillus]|uniref:ATP-binding protein n=1 Tax=Metabacillus hrfriensis TaxID=3048891 RepID=A0ACD4R8H5_9BACI|nr:MULTISPECIES: ATP-binding protein [Metabacillus]UAL51274.1 PAS domain-containing protein [Metabacillus dongyingensis]UOK57222.1 ATP-binding protein [Bacillus sp. OVS6]USK27571.1 PAS domain-containing protein [Bacillus sp. CMF21]WHZ56782.1 ATP-binding protein [Metabacillus sp. CT-WN-B3]